VTSAIDLRHGPWTFGPHAGAHLLKADVAASTKGAGDYDLTVGNQHAQSARLNAGARLAGAFRTPWGVLTPHISADYVHDLADGVGAVDVRPRNYRLRSARRHRMRSWDCTDSPEAGYFVWSVGASAQIARAVSGFIDYRSFRECRQPRDQRTQLRFAFGRRALVEVEILPSAPCSFC
jgi:outer membrane lipase/esterase